jgi:hypothetical protein
MITAFAVIIAIPAYLGAIEFAAWRSFIYSGVAASGMAAGEYVDASQHSRLRANCFALVAGSHRFGRLRICCWTSLGRLARVGPFSGRAV